MSIRQVSWSAAVSTIALPPRAFPGRGGPLGEVHVLLWSTMWPSSRWTAARQVPGGRAPLLRGSLRYVSRVTLIDGHAERRCLAAVNVVQPGMVYAAHLGGD